MFHQSFQLRWWNKANIIDLRTQFSVAPPNRLPIKKRAPATVSVIFSTPLFLKPTTRGRQNGCSVHKNVSTYEAKY